MNMPSAVLKVAAAGVLLYAQLGNAFGAARSLQNASEYARSCDVNEPASSKICDEQGVVYANRCVFEIARAFNASLQLAPFGVCSEAEVVLGSLGNLTISACDEDAPVCGSDGVTYSNMCMLTRFNATVLPNIAKVADGACIKRPANRGSKCVKKCPKLHYPICASNGKLYPNPCSFKNAKCQLPTLQLAPNETCAAADTAMPMPTLNSRDNA